MENSHLDIFDEIGQRPCTIVQGFWPDFIATLKIRKKYNYKLTINPPTINRQVTIMVPRSPWSLQLPLSPRPQYQRPMVLPSLIYKLN